MAYLPPTLAATGAPPVSWAEDRRAAAWSQIEHVDDPAVQGTEDAHAFSRPGRDPGHRRDGAHVVQADGQDPLGDDARTSRPDRS
jgi:hypothetical protein